MYILTQKKIFDNPYSNIIFKKKKTLSPASESLAVNHPLGYFNYLFEVSMIHNDVLTYLKK